MEPIVPYTFDPYSWNAHTKYTFQIGTLKIEIWQFQEMKNI